jgi:hypothetical protein
LKGIDLVIEPRAEPFSDIGYKGSEIRVGCVGSGDWVLDGDPRFLNGSHQPEMCVPKPPLFSKLKNFANAKPPDFLKKSTSAQIKIPCSLKDPLKNSGVG